MQRIFVGMLLFIFSLVVSAQRQLDIQGVPSSPDTVASIRVNYTGSDNVVGLKVHASPASHLGIGGYFYGGSMGVRSETTSGTAVSALSTEGTGVYGVSTHTGVLGMNLDDLSGFIDLDAKGGVVGYSQSNSGVLGESVHASGLLGTSTFGPGIIGNTGNGFVNVTNNLTGVVGMSYTHALGHVITSRVGVYGLSDSVGVLGSSINQDGYGVLGVTHAFRGRAIKGRTTGANSIGVYGEAHGANSTAVWGEGVTGGFFRGSSGTAIQLGGVVSAYSVGSIADDAVLRSQKNQSHGDLFLVTNDEIAIHLDDDGNSEGHFKVFNGDTVQIFSLDEHGNLTISGNCYCANLIAGAVPDGKTSNGEVVGSINHRDLDLLTHSRTLPNLSTGTNITDLLGALSALKQENEVMKQQINELYQRLQRLE